MFLTSSNCWPVAEATLCDFTLGSKWAGKLQRGIGYLLENCVRSFVLCVGIQVLPWCPWGPAELVQDCNGWNKLFFLAVQELFRVLKGKLMILRQSKFLPSLETDLSQDFPHKGWLHASSMWFVLFQCRLSKNHLKGKKTKGHRCPESLPCFLFCIKDWLTEFSWNVECSAAVAVNQSIVIVHNKNAIAVSVFKGSHSWGVDTFQ